MKALNAFSLLLLLLMELQANESRQLLLRAIKGAPTDAQVLTNWHGRTLALSRGLGEALESARKASLASEGHSLDLT